jgi:hypothetical protein
MMSTWKVVWPEIIGPAISVARAYTHTEMYLYIIKLALVPYQYMPLSGMLY